uniref:Uncharacterized protein n=1 Tax=Avena sativa TaxID=4498 RepID=A0ACD5Z4N4_AVESA
MLPLFASSECFALRAEHNGKFLQAVHHKGDGGSRVEASADTVAGNARARFFVEPSEEHEGWVHIRYCYNNKYWVFVLDGDDNHCWYVSAAHGPNEDMRSDSCTLFKPILEDGQDNRIRLQVSGNRSGKYASMLPMSDITRPCLHQSDQEESFSTIGLWRQNELPKYVAFKGDNDKYLRYKDTWLRFDIEDIRDEGVICTVYTNDDGTVQIKSNKGGYWMQRSDYDSWVDAHLSSHNNNDPDMTFKVFTGDEGFIALQNMGNHKFCNRLEFRDWVSYLSASEKSISQGARFKLEEPVVRREIYDVEFNLDGARIYNNALIVLDEDQRTNNTSSVQTGSFSFTARTGVVTSWETTVSSKTASKKNISAKIGKVPIVIGAEVTLSSEAASSQIEAGSEDNSEQTTDTQNFIVHPGQTITGKYVAMQASCDVPYSYKERIVLTTGETIVTVHEDGIYTGVNKSDFNITLTQS